MAGQSAIPDDPGMDPWPFRHLVLRTPRLELRPDDDAGLLELIEVARKGVHPPEEMPFSLPWTDWPHERMALGALQQRWRSRAAHTAASWDLGFLVRHRGKVIGTQSLVAQDFAELREVSCGCWYGLEHQGQGFGSEAWAAVLAFAFDHLGATHAHATAFVNNAGSRAVSRKLGYQDNGTRRVLQRDKATFQIDQRLTPAEFLRPDWALQVEGLEACRELLGA
ncbi:GNAT family N-acetyltransferase [Crossiella sp. CA198]|uniref:GNAT family N-acetyltransferase n=1 Tax=Crossiella sp. CA198 TaxID=3455607 RepID=UPI003F8D4235